MNLLVTGGTGFLGSALVPILAGAGHRLRLLQRSPAKEAEALGAEVLRGSVEDPAAVEAALSGVEAVLHLAGQVDFDPRDPVRLYALHVQGTRLLLEAAVKAGVEGSSSPPPPAPSRSSRRSAPERKPTPTRSRRWRAGRTTCPRSTRRRRRSESQRTRVSSSSS